MREQVAQVVFGKKHAHRFGGGEAEPTLIFPGSFNPLHDGHRKMAAIASRRYRQPVHFEVSVLNVDKRPLTTEEAEARIAQFDANANIWLTRASTFIEKAQFFPRATFIVGADTAVRLLDIAYYRDEIARDRAMALLVQQQCRFLVFGRLIDGSFTTASSLAVPSPVDQLFIAVPKSEFREDISSTELRRQSESKPS